MHNILLHSFNPLTIYYLSEAICITSPGIFYERSLEQIATISIKYFSDFENGPALENEAKIKKTIFKHIINIIK